MNPAKVVSPALPKTAAETLKDLASSRDSGLTKADAAARFAKQGPNEVPEKRSHPILRFAKKFWGLSAWMIELIAVLSFFLHKRADFVIALSLLVANAILSFFQEQRASAAVKALRNKLQVTARVLRDAIWQAVPARDLVTGDVVRVRAGDFVPADVQNAIVDHHRKSPGDRDRREDAEFEDIAEDAVVEAPTPCACGPRLLDGLRPNYAEAIRRVDLEGEEPSSAAAALGISQGNLDVRLHRARRNLRNEVRAYCGAAPIGRASTARATTSAAAARPPELA